MKRKKRRKKSKTFLQDKQLLIIFLVLAAISVFWLMAQERETLKIDESKTPLLTIEANRQYTWFGNDSALEHKIGHQTEDESWVSEAGNLGYFSLGPHATIEPGGYVISFDLKAEGPLNDGDLVSTLDITQDNGQSIMTKSLYYNEFNKDAWYQTFNISIITGNQLRDVEFRVYQQNSKVNLSLRKIEVNPGKMIWTGSDPELSHEIGKQGPGTSWNSGDGGDGFLISSGPNITLLRGVYFLSYTFIITEGTADDSKPVASIQASTNGRTFLYGGLTGVDFNKDASPTSPIIVSFTNKITADNTLKNVEFKLHYPNSTVKVTLKDITLFMQR